MTVSKVSAAQRDRAVAQYMNNGSPSEIAARLGVQPHNVYDWVRARGLSRPSKHGASTKRPSREPRVVIEDPDDVAAPRLLAPVAPSALELTLSMVKCDDGEVRLVARTKPARGEVEQRSWPAGDPSAWGPALLRMFGAEPVDPQRGGAHGR